MRQIIPSSAFLRSVKKWCKKDSSLRTILENVLDTLLKNPSYPSLKSHKVSSQHGTVFASWVTGELRLLWDFTKEGDILLIDMGTHKEMYG